MSARTCHRSEVTSRRPLFSLRRNSGGRRRSLTLRHSFHALGLLEHRQGAKMVRVRVTGARLRIGNAYSSFVGGEVHLAHESS